ncbi:hypothetical protein DFH27DRAFT_547315 [Peziza echinospora]|nr:hypothetical protein DFH27DRAFT_547315 [Peziza echinospora]
MAFAVIATILSLAWMCWRASVLLKIPIPTLVKLLGLELPSPPRVSLHGIAADSVTLHWSLPDKAGSVAKHIIQINGINVGESERRGETSVTVTGLNPDHLYNVRVIAANHHNFQAPGQLIRLRTRRKSIDMSEGGPRIKGEHVDESPSIQPHVPVLEPHTSQHHYHHNSHGKRPGRERRHTYTSAIIPDQQGPNSSSDEQRTIESLTAELEVIRAEIDDLEVQMGHAEEENRAAEGVLTAELELLREKKRTEDAGRHQLRTETRGLEEAKRAAEALKTKTEKALKAREDEIRKMRQESVKWEKERLHALERAETLEQEAKHSRDRAESTEKELTAGIAEAQSKIIELEEEIRSVISSIKVLEAEKEQTKADAGNAANHSAQDERLEKEWLERQKNLEMRYVSIFNAFNIAQDDYNKSRDALAFWKARRDSGPTAETSSLKKAKQRRNRNRKSRAHTLSSSDQPFPVQDNRFPDVSGFANQILQPSSLSPTYAQSNSSLPYFNAPNGHMDDSYSDDRHGSTIMSPTADSLLPSDLFASVGDPPSPTSRPRDEHRNSLHDSFRYPPQSPISSGSRSTSHLSSPRSSFQHMPQFPPSGDGLGTDSERGSATNNLAPLNGLRGRGQTPADNVSGTRKFVNFFLSNKQRGKTLPIEQPLLGSLKPSESQSFPHNYLNPPGLDPIGTRRRSGSYGSWNPGPNLQFMNGRKGDDNDDQNGVPELSRLHHGSDYGEHERLFDRSEPVSPRPLSLASFEGVLPRPSSGVSAAFGWPAEPHLPRGNRINLLSTNWSDYTGHQHMMPNNASTTSFHSGLSPPTLPATTVNNRPRADPRLNPAAPTFESSFLSHMHSPFHTDSVSIHTENSQTDISVSTADSASGSVIESVPTKESLFSRLSLSRKGSTSKFNISWKKDGGLFGRSKRDHTATTASEAGEDDQENETPDGGSVLPSPNPVHSDKPGMWKKDSSGGFFSRKKGPASDTGDEADKEKEKDTAPPSLAIATEATIATVPASSSSPWLKKDGTGFFSRKAKDHDGGESSRRVGSDPFVANSPTVTSKREGLFFKSHKEKEKEKQETPDVHEAEGEDKAEKA